MSNHRHLVASVMRLEDVKRELQAGLEAMTDVTTRSDSIHKTLQVRAHTHTKCANMMRTLSRSESHRGRRRSSRDSEAL